jgi:hypothetical protein
METGTRFSPALRGDRVVAQDEPQAKSWVADVSECSGSPALRDGIGAGSSPSASWAPLHRLVHLEQRRQLLVQVSFSMVLCLVFDVSLDPGQLGAADGEASISFLPTERSEPLVVR